MLHTCDHNEKLIMESNSWSIYGVTNHSIIVNMHESPHITIFRFINSFVQPKLHCIIHSTNRWSPQHIIHSPLCGMFYFHWNRRLERCGAMASGARFAQWLERRGLPTEGSRVRILVELLRNFDNAVYPTLPVSFKIDPKSRWSLLSGVYARESKISHTRGKCVTCRGLHILPGQ